VGGDAVVQPEDVAERWKASGVARTCSSTAEDIAVQRMPRGMLSGPGETLRNVAGWRWKSRQPGDAVRRLLRLLSGLFLLVYFYFALSDTLDPSLTHTPLAHALDPSLTHMPFALLFCLCTDHIYYYKYLDFMSVDTQFIITCSTLGITLYLSEANQVYSLSCLTIA